VPRAVTGRPMPSGAIGIGGEGAGTIRDEPVGASVRTTGSRTQCGEPDGADPVRPRHPAVAPARETVYTRAGVI